MKFIALISAAMLVLTSCKNEPTEVKTVETHHTETIKEVEKDTVKPKPVEEKGTTVKIGPGGGSVNTKDVDVEIKNQ